MTAAVIQMKEHHLVHAPRSMFLPATLRVQTKIVTHPNTTRRLVRKPKKGAVGHDTGNPRTNALAEWNWLAGGRKGGSKGSYNAIVDDGGVIYCAYLDEETWHAGLGWWNEWTWGTELAYGGAVVWTVAWENWCAWLAGLLEMGDLDPVTAFHFHEAVYGKYCPAQVFLRNLRGATTERIIYYWKLARAAREGRQPATPGIYALPQPPIVDGVRWDGKRDTTINGVKFEAQRATARTTVVLNQRQWGSTESLLTGPAHPAGTEVELLGWVKGELVDGISEWWVDVDGHRLWAGGIDLEPKEDPDWAEVPAEMPAGTVVVNGRVYLPLVDEDTGELGRKIDIIRDGELRKWAETGEHSPVVGAVEAGTERIFKYWTRGEALDLELADGQVVKELIWFAEDVHGGARMWSGLSRERPD